MKGYKISVRLEKYVLMVYYTTFIFRILNTQHVHDICVRWFKVSFLI
jgi:hypothetical protein